MIPSVEVILIIHGTVDWNCAIYTFDNIESARLKEAELRKELHYNGESSIYERVERVFP